MRVISIAGGKEEMVVMLNAAIDSLEQYGQATIGCESNDHGGPEVIIDFNVDFEEDTPEGRRPLWEWGAEVIP